MGTMQYLFGNYWWVFVIVGLIVMIGLLVEWAEQNRDPDNLPLTNEEHEELNMLLFKAEFGEELTPTDLRRICHLENRDA